MRFREKSVWLVLIVCMPLLVCLQAVAQTNSGRILGSVADQTGAALNGASVIVTDMQRGVTRSLKSDEAGAYVAPELLPGTYKVRAEAKGFKSVERINITLEIAKDVVVDFQLQPGEVKETVVVSEEVPLLDTTSATLGGTTKTYCNYVPASCVIRAAGSRRRAPTVCVRKITPTSSRDC